MLPKRKAFEGKAKTQILHSALYYFTLIYCLSGLEETGSFVRLNSTIIFYFQQLLMPFLTIEKGKTIPTIEGLWRCAMFIEIEIVFTQFS